MSKIDVQAPSATEDFDTVNNTISDDASTTPPESTELVADRESVPESEPFEPEAKPTPELAPPDAATQVNPIEEPAQPASANGRVRRPFGHILIEAVLALAVVGLGLWSWNLYTDRKNLQEQLSKVNANPQALVEKQTQDLIDRVGNLMQLPTGETPTIAAVSDAAQARQQSAFFANAQNGDKVLMYVKAGKAILYRPSTNQIILVAPLTFNGTATGATTKQ